MIGSEYRQITLSGEAPKRERLFRAAVSAFCSLTRPSRRDISQIDELTLPLFEGVSQDSRRYVAAALSECASPPPGLVRRLCDEPVEIAAPLLIRSKALTDIDLLTFIGRHGAAHARAISRRTGLHPTIADLVAVIERKWREESRQHADSGDSGLRQDGKAEPSPQSGDDTRRRLRSMMLPSAGSTSRGGPASARYGRLRDTALTGHTAFFHTALADALGVDYAAICRVARTNSYAWLLPALRALDLTEERALLIAAAMVPSGFSGSESIRLFLARYAQIGSDLAVERVRAWQADRSDGEDVLRGTPAAAQPEAADERRVTVEASG